MPYEQRLKLAKILGAALLFLTFITLHEGLEAPKDSAQRALSIMSFIIVLIGMVLIWHKKLHGTGRSVRMAMFLLSGVLTTLYLTVGVTGIHFALFIGALTTIILSIRRGKTL